MQKQVEYSDAIKTKYPEPAKEINSVLLSDAVANFECELDSQAEAGDHIIFIGKIVCSHMSTESKKRLYTIAPGHKLGPAY
jgi:flavin reductase (DIM6/NTAB) family NADH-FMN oxidoreductase RutF